MKKYIFITTLLAISSLLLSGCMTTWPIVDDLDHYKKWDTYESVRGKNEEKSMITSEDIEEVVEEEAKENFEENLEDEISDTNDTEISENDEEQIIEGAVVQE